MIRRQNGIALIGLVALLTLAATWWFVSALNNSFNRTASDRDHNAQVLAEAKAALIGWVAMNAASSAENNPGRLPCPETPVQIGTANEGLDPPIVGVPVCSAAAGPVIGRLPWKALGINQLRDAANEPLWYVVTAGTWALQNSVGSTTINSNTPADLVVDGALPAVALIIAPGGPLRVQASANCAARNQARGIPGPAMDFRDYLECQNATSPADAAFASGGPSGSFNDQVLTVTIDDVMPVIEAAVADRFERNVASLLRSVYSNSDGTNASWPATPRLPFAAGFPNPVTYKGVAATTQGLLPFTYATDGAGGACAVADPRCDPNFVAWRVAPAPTISAPGMVAGSQNCNATPTTITCSFRATHFTLAPATAQFTINHTASNVGLSLRQFNTAVAMANVQAAGRAASGSLNVDGSAAISVSGTTNVAGGGNLIGALLEGLLCGLGGLLGLIMDCATHTVTVPIAIMADHPLILDNAANPQRWFVRNGWHQVSYYAIAPTMAPGAAGGCTSNVDCLGVTFHPNTARQRGLIAIGGPALAGQTRAPLGGVADLLEGPNADGNTALFAVRSPPLMINRTFNDRIAVIDLSP